MKQHDGAEIQVDQSVMKGGAWTGTVLADLEAGYHITPICQVACTLTWNWQELDWWKRDAYPLMHTLNMHVYVYVHQTTQICTYVYIYTVSPRIAMYAHAHMDGRMHARTYAHDVHHY